MVQEELLAALVRLNLCGPEAKPVFKPLTGGVSSDIWRVDLDDRVICVKRALKKLRVEADWYAPVERNAYEAAWMREAGAIVPDAVPELLGQDEESGLLAMAYLPPDRFPLWKNQLRRGSVDPGTAAAVGACLAAIHRMTAGDPALKTRFPNDRIFYDIRLEPYLVATANLHPDRVTALLGPGGPRPKRTGRLWFMATSAEKHSDRPDRSGVFGRRVRLSRRSGVRSRLLPEPSSPEMSLVSSSKVAFLRASMP